MAPPGDDLRSLRAVLRDPRLVVFKRRMGGWLVAQVGGVRYPDGTRTVSLYERAIVPALGPTALAELIPRSEVHIGRVAVEEAIPRKLAEYEKANDDAIAATTKESDEKDYATRIKPALAARGAHNVPYEDRVAPMKAAEKAIEAANGDVNKIPLSALGVTKIVQRRAGQRRMRAG